MTQHRQADEEQADEGQAGTYLAEVRRDLRVERALIWKEAVAMLVVAAIVIAYLLWAR